MRLAPALALLVLAAPAWASTPVSTYVYPNKVEYFPDQKTATSVAIHGAFFFYNKAMGYDAPTCGYMYFQCGKGEDVMCRMQWDEINAAIGGQMCQGFGQLQMITTATLRKEGTPLANPDAWDLGMGIQPGVFVDGQCAPAMKLNCMGAPPVDMSIGPPPDLATNPPADMGTSPPPDLTQTAPPDLTQTSSPDLSKGGATPGGCTLSGRATAPTALFGLIALLALAARRRR